MLPRPAVTFALAVLACPAIARAQLPPAFSSPSRATQPPAYVAVTEGVAFIERDGRVESTPLNMPLVAGDRLRTTEGRMEVRFADGSALDLDARTAIDMQSDTLLRLMGGRVRLTVRTMPSTAWRIDSPAGSARLEDIGEYRLTLIAGSRPVETDVQLELAVVRGSAEIFTDHGQTPVLAGERAYASADLLPSNPYPFNSAVTDDADFDRWPATPTPLGAEPSAQYLPPDLQTYASTLDAYGDWGYLQPYGYVWYPRVSHDWRPYAHGRWMTYSRFGLTWVGTERFAWPTHHYGRWTQAKGQWCWIPASQWSPAHVAWSSAGDSVSWTPLGPNNRVSQTSSARTVVSRADFDRRPIVPDTRVIDQTRVAPIVQPGIASPPRAAPREGRPFAPAVQRPYVMPARTTPPPNPVPQSEVRGQRPAVRGQGPEVRGPRSGAPSPPAAAPVAAPPSATPPTRVWQTQPASGAQPRPSTPAAPAAQPQPAKPAAQAPSKQSPPAASAAPSNGTAARRGRGGV